MDTFPERLMRQKIHADLDKRLIARAMAELVKAMLAAVDAGRDDYWVNVDLDFHIQSGKALEKFVRINVYGDLLDTSVLCPAAASNENEVPSEIFRSFCEPTE